MNERCLTPFHSRAERSAGRHPRPGGSRRPWPSDRFGREDGHADLRRAHPHLYGHRPRLTNPWSRPEHGHPCRTPRRVAPPCPWQPSGCMPRRRGCHPTLHRRSYRVRNALPTAGTDRRRSPAAACAYRGAGTLGNAPRPDQEPAGRPPALRILGSRRPRLAGIAHAGGGAEVCQIVTERCWKTALTRVLDRY